MLRDTDDAHAVIEARGSANPCLGSLALLIVVMSVTLLGALPLKGPVTRPEPTQSAINPNTAPWWELTLLPRIKRLGVPLVCLTGNRNSTLARKADVILDVSVAEEACPLGLAPTASTTAALAMGDALAVALLQDRGFTREDFARSHPAGTLGRRMLLHVADIMHTGERIPQVTLGTSLKDTLVEMSHQGLGMSAVVDGAGRVRGIYTDGDLRRTLERPIHIHTVRVEQVMTPDPVTVTPQLLAAEALRVMEQRKINGLLIVDAAGALVGALNMHDLLRAGIF